MIRKLGREWYPIRIASVLARLESAAPYRAAVMREAGIAAARRGIGPGRIRPPRRVGERSRLHEGEVDFSMRPPLKPVNPIARLGNGGYRLEPLGAGRTARI